MEVHGRACSSGILSEEEMDLRRGPWTLEEDFVLVNYIASHGEGRWNLLARCAGLKRTGKSCRLRWLNYLRPDVRRGNITPEEQLLILELHSRWGNRWSRIAQHLPGRTDNEIKNYWRTRVQKHAKHLQCDVDSKQFKDVMRYLWMPRLIERIRSATGDLPTMIPATEHGITAGGDGTSCIGSCSYPGETWELFRTSAECSSDSWGIEHANPETMSSAGSAADGGVAEKRKGSEGVQFTAPPQMGGGKRQGEPGMPGKGYAHHGLPEMQQYCGLEGEMCDSWNIEDIWYLLQ